MTTNCSADIGAAAAYLDGVLTNGSTQDVNLVKGLAYLANNPDIIAQYGNLSGKVTSLSKLCSS